jgi:inosine-uridine nucleoside N-ribohydrolase
VTGSAAATPIPVVLDVDTGIDDACALLFAVRHPGLDLRAVTCVAGNSSLDDVVRNTQTVLAVAGASEVQVARGADRPLLSARSGADHVHGLDGMADLGWAPGQAALVDRHAVELLRDVLLDAAARGERVTLVALAPMTNVALLLRTYPQVAAGLARLVFMGGSAGIGNVTASAEFNVWHDPEAAALTLSACQDLGVPVTMYGLDADRATIGDAGAVCAVVDPGGLTTRSMPIRVELAGTWTRGRTVADGRPHQIDLDHDPHGVPPTPVDVAVAVDGERYARLWLDTVAPPT